jgi:drug/metabolite transporter (DMT)-like permease
MNTQTLILLALTSLVTAASQTLFKQVLTANQIVIKADKSIFSTFIGLVSSPVFLGALVLYGLAFILWIYLLSRTQLSIIYPIGISLNVLLMLFTARFVLGESLTVGQIFGIAVILVGIIFITVKY